MKRNAPKSASSNDGNVINHDESLQVVRDSRKNKIRGLWFRKGVYYLQIRIKVGNEGSKPVKVRLDATTLAEAKIEAAKKRTENQTCEMHVPGWRPKFDELVEIYTSSKVFEKKKVGTQENEIQSLNRWNAHLGSCRIDRIDAALITSFRDNRSGVSARTINLDVTAFSNAMRYALDLNYLTILPKVKRLEQRPPVKKRLLTKAEIARLLSNCHLTKNGVQLSLYLRLLISSGGREQETLKIRKDDVNLDRKVLRIGADGDTKNSDSREIQFNTELDKVTNELLDMLPSDTEWLFPSPQRGKKDRHSKTFRESLRIVAKASGLEWVGFHHFRVYFASTAVMAGIDYMTIAEWLGHQDGGQLVAEVYGHLNDAHKKSAAKLLKF